MDADELRAIRAALGLTWKKLAEALQVNWRTVAAWERGEARISGPVALAVRGLAEKGVQEASNGPPGTVDLPRHPEGAGPTNG